MDLEQHINNDKLIREWVDNYSEYLYTWAFYKTSNKETAEDVVQETYLAAFNSIDNFENRSNPKTWLTSILNNKIYDYYKKKAKSLINNNAMKIDDDTDFLENYFDVNGNWKQNPSTALLDNDENLLDNIEFLEILQLCISNLPELWRFAVKMKYFNDKNGNEICQDLNITQSNYWQILHRAKLQLRKCVEKNWYQ